MTEIITPAELQAGTIAAYRYLAFLDAERRMLLSEVLPGWQPGQVFFVPADMQVHALMEQEPVLDRCEKVLRALDIDPHRHEAWVNFIGVDPSQVPVLKFDGEKLRRRPQ